MANLQHSILAWFFHINFCAGFLLLKIDVNPLVADRVDVPLAGGGATARPGFDAKPEYTTKK